MTDGAAVVVYTGMVGSSTFSPNLCCSFEMITETVKTCCEGGIQPEQEDENQRKKRKRKFKY